MAARRLAALAPAALALCCGAPPAPGDDLDAALARASARHAPHLVAIAYLDLGGGRAVLVRADEVVHAASTMKVPVMIELFRRADAGALSLDREIELRNEFRSIVDGSRYALEADDDSDPALYRRIGERVTVRELIRRMIARSSNLATNLLVELAGPERIQSTIEALGTTRMRVLRGVEDTKAYRAGLSNTTTARDLMVLLAAIARGEAASPAACGEMIEILAAQEFDDKIPAGLPPGTRVAHKTGRITAIHHDAAIVYPDRGSPWVLVVLTRGFADPEESARAIAAIAALVHRRRPGP